jgi:hypothetical protein
MNQVNLGALLLDTWACNKSSYIMNFAVGQSGL